jgi:hypothetical protein
MVMRGKHINHIYGAVTVCLLTALAIAIYMALSRWAAPILDRARADMPDAIRAALIVAIAIVYHAHHLTKKRK